MDYDHEMVTSLVGQPDPKSAQSQLEMHFQRLGKEHAGAEDASTWHPGNNASASDAPIGTTANLGSTNTQPGPNAAKAGSLVAGDGAPSIVAGAAAGKVPSGAMAGSSLAGPASGVSSSDTEFVATVAERCDHAGSGATSDGQNAQVALGNKSVTSLG